MRDDKGRGKDIVPSSGGSLAIFTSGLIKRGLDLAEKVEFSDEELKGHFERGLKLFHHRKYTEAEALFRKVITFKPVGNLDGLFFNGYIMVAECLKKQGKYNEAEAIYREIIRHGLKDFDELRVLFYLQRVIEKQGREFDFETECRSVISRHPDSVEAHFELGELLVNTTNEWFEDQEDKYVGPDFKLFKAAHLDKYDVAESVLRRAINLDPNFERAHSSLADLLCNKGEFDKESVERRVLIKLNPKEGIYHLNYSQCLIELGDFLNAVNELNAAIRLPKTLYGFPNSSPHSVLFNLASALDERGRRGEARHYWKILLDWGYYDKKAIEQRLAEPD
jgi:tetratricopeptide (TPR) repeat protein